MYWDPMLPNLVLQNPPIMQNPPYHQNTNPNFDHLLFPGNSTNNLINNNNNGFSTVGFNSNNEFSTLGFGTGGGGPHDFAADETHDQLAASLNRLSISNNGSSGNQRMPNNYMPSSTILGNGGFSTLEQEYLERLNQYAFLMAEQYMRRSNPTTANNGILNPHSWNQNSTSSSRSTSQSIYGDQFGLGFNQIRSSSSSQRNGVSRGSRFANGAGRQRFGQEERSQGLNLMSTKDQRLGNGAARRHIPSYYSVPLEELRGQIAFVAKDHVGCRFLQKKIEEGKMEEIEMIFNEVMKEGHDHLRELMVDQFGTEFIQKLVEGTNRDGWTKMLDLVMSDERKLKDMCTDQHGSRAMQKLLERVETREQQSSFMRVLKRITIPLSKTQPGYYVIQVCLKNFSPDCTKGVLELVLDNCLALAKDKFGCCLVQSSVHYAYTEAKERLVADITEHARVLSEDPYGNYVVQYIIGLKIPRVTADILGQLQGYFVNLSMNKHGSNVVEKTLKEAGEEHANMIINEMINSPEFLNVLQNPYGNYVAQSALAVSKGSVHNALVNLIRINYPHLHSHLYGKRVLDKTRGGRHRA
ncbi:pumilio [Rosa sericea]